MKNLEIHRKYIKKTLNKSEKSDYKKLLRDDVEFREESRELKELSGFFDSKMQNIDVPDTVTAKLFENVGIKPKRRNRYKYFALLLLIPFIYILSNNLFYKDSIDDNKVSEVISDSNSATKENNIEKDSENTKTNENIINESDYDENRLKWHNNHLQLSNNSNDFAYNSKLVINNTDEIIEKPVNSINNIYSSVFVDNVFDIALNTNQPDEITNNDNIEYKTQSENSSNISFELTNAPGWYFTKPVVNNNSGSQIENFEYVILYSINKKFRVGVLYKNELLLTNYSITNDINTFNYYKYVTLNSFGLVAEYNIFDISTNIHPFLRVGAAYATNAFTLKEMIGMKYSLYNDVYFKLGLETNQYFYKAINQNNTIGKYNFVFGVGLKF